MNDRKTTAHRHATAERLFRDVPVAVHLKGIAAASEDARRAIDTAKTVKLRALRKASEAVAAQPKPN